MPGFIVFEGIDGCGKTTQLDLLQGYLKGKLQDVERLRNPGSTEMGERIRTILLHSDYEIHPKVELMLFMAGHAQLANERIWPATRADRIVLLDRYYFSTMAYQGASDKEGLFPQWVLEEVEFLSLPEPGLVILLDGDPREFAERRRRRGDRIERRGVAYQTLVRAEYLEIANRYKTMFKRIDGTAPPEVVSRHINEAVDEYLQDAQVPAQGRP